MEYNGRSRNYCAFVPRCGENSCVLCTRQRFYRILFRSLFFFSRPYMRYVHFLLTLSQVRTHARTRATQIGTKSGRICNFRTIRSFNVLIVIFSPFGFIIIVIIVILSIEHSKQRARRLVYKTILPARINTLKHVAL